MSVYRVIDKLESAVRSGVWLPFGARIVDQDQMLDLVEKLRANLPDEVNRAKAVTKEKDRLIEEARAQAGAIVEEASTAKTRLIDDNEIVRQAKAEAERILAEARTRSDDIKSGADRYADEILGNLDRTLSTTLAVVHKGRQALAHGPDTGNGKVR